MLAAGHYMAAAHISSQGLCLLARVQCLEPKVVLILESFMFSDMHIDITRLNIPNLRSTMHRNLELIEKHLNFS